MSTAKKKIAIACQGGGSQTAFTAGALKGLLDGGVLEHFDVVSLSGTSGGALCASLVWYAIQKGDSNPSKRLMDFWTANTAQSHAEQMFNRYLVDASRKVTKGEMPTISLAPDSMLVKTMMSISTMGLRKEFTDFELLLTQHFDFDELLAWGPRKEGPVLAMGAVNVLTGRLAVFNSRTMLLRSEFIRSSCAIPTLFPAVEYDGQAYWDGLFSDNPPLTELTQVDFVGKENLPEELWVIKINSTGCDKIPRTPDEIADRHNELVGNVSLFQQLDTLAWMNDLLLRGAFNQDFLDYLDIKAPLKIPQSYLGSIEREYHIPYLEMSAALQKKLDYESKLDRNPENILPMIADGEAQAALFLAERLAAK